MRAMLLLLLFFIATTFTAGCIQKSPSQPYTCPAKDRIDCMPGPSPHPAVCSGDYHEWVVENCNVTFGY